MTAPTPTARSTPGGRKLGTGFPITIAFSLDPDISIWEKSVTPMGIEGDDPNDTTNMHNDTWRTKSPRTLMTGTDVTITCQFSPGTMVQMEAIINVPQVITEHYPDGASICYYGFVKSYIPGDMTEEVPESTVTIIPTNQDPITCAEEGPVYSPGSGTASSC